MVNGRTVLAVIMCVVALCMSVTFAKDNYRFYQCRTGKEKQVLARNVIIYSLLFIYAFFKVIMIILGG